MTVLLLGACSSGNPRAVRVDGAATSRVVPATVTPEPVTPDRVPPVSVPVRPTPAPATLVSSASGDLDEDGTIEEIRLMSDGGLHVFHGETEVLDTHGHAAGQLDGSYDSYWRDFSVVDIRAGDGRRELQWMWGAGEEDPPYDYAYWTYREGRLWPMLHGFGTNHHTIEVPHGVAPIIRGNGVIEFRYEHCVRYGDDDDGHGGTAERVHLRYVLDGDDLVANREATRHPADCIFAACPFVYAGGDLVGEALRNLRGEDAETWQPLAIPISRVDADGVLRLVIREEKDEVTYLDAVSLEIDGMGAPALPCDEPWCAPDQRRLMLTPGESLELDLAVPPGARTLTLWARGYYVR